MHILKKILLNKKYIKIIGVMTLKNSGEGILARNFLKLLKNKYTNYKYINLTYSKKNNFLYNYILPYWGIIKIWNYHLKCNYVCYINYLPVWNFFNFFTTSKRNYSGSNHRNNYKKKFYLQYF